MEQMKKERTFQSDEIKELVSALSKAQGVMEPAKFNKINPHFRNRYADFKSCMDACRAPLSDNGLSVMQYCEDVNGKLILVTMLAHSSGQWIKSDFPLIPKNMDSQSIGSAMTYGKRYSLSCMLGIVSDDDDDDAELANGRGNTNKPASLSTASSSEISTKQIPQQKTSSKSQKLESLEHHHEEIVKLNDDQVKNLENYLDLCESKFRQTIIDRFHSLVPAIKTYHDIPFKVYERAITAIKLHLKYDEKAVNQ